MEIAVIGAGAAGMMAAITAARLGAKVTIFERNQALGKKLLMTGNGRCNITNEKIKDLSTDNINNIYSGTHPDVAGNVISQFTYEDTVRFFNSIGIMLKSRAGYMYPYSDQALQVRDLLQRELEKNMVNIRTNIKVTGICKNENDFSLNLGKPDGTMEIENYQRIILCAGSRAYSKTGSDGFGYKLCKKLNIPLVKVLPALTRCKTKDLIIKAAGVRWVSKATLIIDDREIKSDIGEVQFTKEGLSGIVIMQLSSIAARALYDDKRVKICLDLFPELSEAKLQDELDMRRDIKSVYEALRGMLPDALIAGLIERYDGKINSTYLKAVEIDICEVGGFDESQVCTGGVDVSCLDERLMVKKIEGLYIAGELLDIDGICGGYNLQFAWSSGYVAGRAAAT